MMYGATDRPLQKVHIRCDGFEAIHLQPALEHHANPFEQQKTQIDTLQNLIHHVMMFEYGTGGYSSS